MSFLSLLLFASAFYFSLARPDTSTGWVFTKDTSDVADPSPNKQLNESAQGFTLNSSDEKLNEFLKEISQMVDEYMTPLITNLDVNKQNEIKAFGLNGFASDMNYMLLLLQDFQNGKVDHEDLDLNSQDIVVEFTTLNPSDSNWPYIAEGSVVAE